MITQEELKDIFEYQPSTGNFIRLKSSGGYAKGSIAGTKNQNGYIEISYKRKKYKAHHLAWIYMYGYKPKNHTDHINHIRTDNRIENLREVTQQENAKNLSIYKNNSSGIHGVNWHKRDKKWTAHIRVDDKQIHLGNFLEFHEAVNARKNAEVLYGFHENHGKVS